MSEKRLTLKQAAKYIGTGEFNMRRLLREGRVQGIKVQEGHLKGDHSGKWYITTTELDKYIASRGKKRDGKRAHILRVSDDRLDEVTKKLEEMGIELNARYQRKNE